MFIRLISILGGNGRGYVITVQCEQRTGILQNSGRHFTNVSIINQNTVPCVKIATGEQTVELKGVNAKQYSLFVTLREKHVLLCRANRGAPVTHVDLHIHLKDDY